MRIKLSVCFLIFLALYSCPRIIFGQAPISNEASLKFADSLFEDKDYYRAVGEYKRCLFLSPARADAQEITYKIGVCYLRGKQFTDALSYFDKAVELKANGPWAEKAEVKKGDVYYYEKNYADAQSHWVEFLKNNPESPLAPRALYLQGWAKVYQLDFQGARSAFEEASKNPGAWMDIKVMSEKTTQRLREASNIPSRSPVVSGLCSLVLPGLGQLYCGRTSDAIASFLLNGLFGYLCVNAVQREDTGGTAVWGTCFFLFYSGNIYGAAADAFRFNKSATQDFVSRLETLKLVDIEESF